MRVKAEPASQSSFPQQSGEHLTPYGVVFCVQTCFKHRLGPNLITLVGVQQEPGYEGFLAQNFRKVEEIKLCVEAAQKVRKPEKEVQKV